jgi:hypothetical protein
MIKRKKIDLLELREALEASWDEKTSYLGVKKAGNPALGQCYPTSRVVQYFFPETEIIKGKVWNGKELEIHFWNGLYVGEVLYHLDLSWQQFPTQSSVREFTVLDRNTLNDSQGTIERCELLLQRVKKYVENSKSKKQ